MSKLIPNPKLDREDDEIESKGPNLILIYSFLLLAILGAMAFAGMVVWPFMLGAEGKAYSWIGKSFDMPATASAPTLKVAVAKITSKGQITLPAETRRLLGVKTGDKLAFQQSADGSLFVTKAEEFPFERFRGMGTGVPELESGREAVIQYLRELRGHDEFDHLD